MDAAPLRNLNTRRVWFVDLTVSAAAGVVLGAIGPFGSFFNDSLLVRAGYWTTVLVFNGVVFGLALRWTLPRARRARLSVWVWAPMLILIVSLAPALVSRLLAIWLWPGIRNAVGPIEWYGQAVLVGLIYASLYIALRLGRPDRDGVKAAPARLLPAQPGRTLLCLQMEDHYVRVHTNVGSELRLMSLSQAIAGLEGVEGLQTHRSWWVSRAAVTGVVEDGRNVRLVLKNGVEAPVSRTRVATLRNAGWL